MNSLVRLHIFKQLTGLGSRLSSVISRAQPLAHFCSFPSSFAVPSNLAISKTTNFLSPPVFSTVPVCGMKVKGRVRKRCRDCYMIWKDHRVYNYCREHPRHNQMSKVERDREYFILTEITRGRIRKY